MLMHSDACERNKGPLTTVLQRYLPESGGVLEVGSGTGQHVVHFARQFACLAWQPTDTGAYLGALRARLAAEPQPNVLPAIELDVRMQPWPVASYAALFSANTLHYMSTACVARFFAGAAAALDPDGVLLVYGPFRYAGEFTSASNAAFDQWLREGDPERGVRDFEWVAELAEHNAMTLIADCDMPANNRCLIWRRSV